MRQDYNDTQHDDTQHYATKHRLDEYMYYGYDN
jgi:hypothetical protein